MSSNADSTPARQLPRLYPWQLHVWARLQQLCSSGRLPHALLLTGAAGIGKRRLAEVLAAALLCHSRQPDGQACGRCRGCELLLAATHPDLRRIEPEEAGKSILIAAIRDFVAGESLTAQAGGYKIVIVDPADAMNASAANSLLKTLEEPVDWTLIVLISSRPGLLPATIRSRCQQIALGLPEREVVTRWLGEQQVAAEPALLLALNAGAPLRAQASADPELLTMRVKILARFAAIVEGREDPVAAAAAWSKLDLPRVLGWYSSWLVDCLRLQADAEFDDLFNPDQRNLLQGIAEKIESKRLFGLLDAAYRAIGAQDSQLNGQMLLESLLLAVSDDIRRSG